MRKAVAHFAKITHVKIIYSLNYRMIDGMMRGEEQEEQNNGEEI